MSGVGVTLVFGAVDLDDALARTWSVVSIASSDAIRSTVIDSAPTLTLDQDGTASVETGCNWGAMSWQRTGRALSFGSIAGTEVGCEADLAAQQLLADAIDATRTFDVTSGHLTLFDGDGHILVIAAETDS
jgi:heat shock protein HslJ